MSTRLDFGQVIKESFDETNHALRVKGVASALVVEPYDYVALTYVASGDGVGQPQTITYKTGGAGGTTVATVSITYNAAGNPVTVTKS